MDFMVDSSVLLSLGAAGPMAVWAALPMGLLPGAAAPEAVEELY
jgi:hypothetical protein